MISAFSGQRYTISIVHTRRMNDTVYIYILDVAIAGAVGFEDAFDVSATTSITEREEHGSDYEKVPKLRVRALKRARVVVVPVCNINMSIVS